MNNAALFFNTGKNIKEFPKVLQDVQEYISNKYSNLISDNPEEQREQIKSYISKYIMDYSLGVEGLSFDELIEKIYSEMAEFSFLTKYLFRKDVEEININQWKDIKITYTNGEILPTKDKFNSPEHAIDVLRSSIKTNTRCICLDTHDLQNTNDNIKKTQYFNILTWCWQEMSKDRNDKVLLICDEAYLMIDTNVPQSLVFLRNVEKRARKYEGGVAIISHSVVDFLDPQIKMYGQALLDIPCFKIIMGTDGRNLQETKELYNLTDEEEELLASKKRGNALLMIGSKRLHVVFEIPEYKFDYMGKAGGR